MNNLVIKLPELVMILSLKIEQQIVGSTSSDLLVVVIELVFFVRVDD